MDKVSDQEIRRHKVTSATFSLLFLVSSHVAQTQTMWRRHHQPSIPLSRPSTIHHSASPCPAVYGIDLIVSLAPM